MSEFIKAVEVLQEGRRIALPAHFEPLSVSQELREAPFSPDAYEYEIGVSWRVRGVCRKTELSMATEAVKQHLRHSIYGEYIGLLYRLEEALLMRKEEEEVHRRLADLKREVLGH